MKKSIEINTVEELVSWIIAHKWHADTKWKLEDWTNWEYVDPEAALTWREMREAEEQKLASVPYDDPQWVEMEKAIRELQPQQIKKVTYSLSECGRDWSSNYIHLSPELGEMLNGIWTHKKETYGNWMKRTGNLTIPGMLKRLGKTDVSTRIADAEAKEQAYLLKVSRNNARQELRKLAEQAAKHLATLGLPQNCNLEDLSKLVDEE